MSIAFCPYHKLFSKSFFPGAVHTRDFLVKIYPLLKYSWVFIKKNNTFETLCEKEKVLTTRNFIFFTFVSFSCKDRFYVISNIHFNVCKRFSIWIRYFCEGVRLKTCKNKGTRDLHILLYYCTIYSFILVYLTVQLSPESA